jgi:hypothetical protein
MNLIAFSYLRGLQVGFDHLVLEPMGDWVYPFVHVANETSRAQRSSAEQQLTEDGVREDLQRPPHLLMGLAEHTSTSTESLGGRRMTLIDKLRGRMIGGAEEKERRQQILTELLEAFESGGKAVASDLLNRLMKDLEEQFEERLADLKKTL